MCYRGRLTCSIFIPNTSKEFLYKSHQQITISYGKAILADLSKRLTDEFGKGFDERELRRIRQFYLVFPKWDALRPE